MADLLISGFEVGDGWSGGAPNTADVWQGLQSYKAEKDAVIRKEFIPSVALGELETGYDYFTIRVFFRLTGAGQGAVVKLTTNFYSGAFPAEIVDVLNIFGGIIWPGDDERWFLVTIPIGTVHNAVIADIDALELIVSTLAGPLQGDVYLDDLRAGPAVPQSGGLPKRVIRVLKDYLPGELDLIDAEEADGIETPDIADDAYHERDPEFIVRYPACSIQETSSTPVEVLSKGMGERVDQQDRLDVMFHATIGHANDPVKVQRLLHRYISGAVRVLCVMKEALQTKSDSTRLVELVTWAGEATYGPEVEQETGAIVRSATLPISIRRREER